MDDHYKILDKVRDAVGELENAITEKRMVFPGWHIYNDLGKDELLEYARIQQAARAILADNVHYDESSVVDTEAVFALARYIFNMMEI